MGTGTLPSRPPLSSASAGQAEAWLRRLRSRARKSQRAQAGRIRLDGLDVAYTDLMSFYMEYKDIFIRRIYHFDSAEPSPRIIDGGGCIGMSVLYFKRVFPAARILAFEPDRALCEILARNVAVNRLSDVQVVPAGLAAAEGTACFQPDGGDGGRVIEGNSAAVTIRTVRLSDCLAEPADFVKLNIEGQELPVLQEVEARGRLPNIRELVLEYHGWAGGPQRLGAILELLDRNGFRYLVHDFDQETNPASKPPFRLARPKTWFCLVYARRA
jgi:FkbM family methyltransferase